MTLQLEYRPKKLKNVAGNDNTKEILETILARDDVPHAFLITGPSGTGKTTIARIIRKRLGCKKSDFYELDSADFRGIDTVRNIRKIMPYAASVGKCRVWLIDECHQMTKDAQEALLKALEDTPSHCYFILATTNPEKLKVTLKRRCTELSLAPLEEDELVALMKKVLKKDGKKVPDSVLEQIYDDSMGSPGIALGVLDKIKDLPEKKMKQAADNHAREQNEVIDLCRALMTGQSWTKISQIAESTRRAVLGYMTSVVLNASKEALGKAVGIVSAFEDNFFDSGKAGLARACAEAYIAG